MSGKGSKKLGEDSSSEEEEAPAQKVPAKKKVTKVAPKQVVLTKK